MTYSGTNAAHTRQRQIESLEKAFPVASDFRASLRVLRSDITWAKCIDSHSWIALVKLNPELEGKFGITREILAVFSKHAVFEARDVTTGKSYIDHLPEGRFVEDFLSFYYCPDERLRDKLNGWNRDGSISRSMIPIPTRGSAKPEAIIASMSGEIKARDWYQNYGVVTGDSFYGRSRLISDISGRLREGAIVGIFGLRKCGKTSLVHEIGRRFEAFSPTRNVFAIVDFESLPNGEDKHQFESSLLLGVATSLRDRFRDLGIKTQRLSGLDSSSTMSDLKSALTASLRDADKRDVEVLLALDEVESLVGSAQDLTAGNREVVPTFLGVLRSLVQEHSNFKVALCGLTSAPIQRDELYGRENPIFSWAVPYFVPGLSREESDELVRGIGRRSAYNWEHEALDALYEASGGNILMLRTLCSRVTQTQDISKFGRKNVEDSLRSWRRENAETFRGLFAGVERHYPNEYDLCLDLINDYIDLEEADDNFPSECHRLVGLDLLRESTDGSLTLGPVAEFLKARGGVK